MTVAELYAKLVVERPFLAGWWAGKIIVLPFRSTMSDDDLGIVHDMVQSGRPDMLEAARAMLIEHAIDVPCALLQLKFLQDHETVKIVRGQVAVEKALYPVCDRCRGRGRDSTELYGICLMCSGTGAAETEEP